jgi:hypothetical protein
VRFALFGGNSNNGANDGVWSFGLSNVFGSRYWGYAASPSCKPLAKTVSEPDLIPTDPPVPFPKITLPNGEATIDIEGELKPQAAITGEIKGVNS